MARTADDIWDPATGVGMTATFGAVVRAVATNKGLLDDPFAERLVRAAGVHYFTSPKWSQTSCIPTTIPTPSPRA
ncbi:putative S-adenosyl-L-methionine-dependent methyltransferase [Mycobacterium shigaense]|uniref:Putative S-adenosyl-L-methionine-dependent methyltransferase n=1 Tax=Mycobacterium shigaense TaxID=722731 RepID=A0A1Z4ECT8_9MYCO|nr:putative S-adenosyl-L-methionine-dependent methyltransferase [Mycobacterium shigaense]